MSPEGKRLLSQRLVVQVTTSAASSPCDPPANAPPTGVGNLLPIRAEGSTEYCVFGSLSTRRPQFVVRAFTVEGLRPCRGPTARPPTRLPVSCWPGRHCADSDGDFGPIRRSSCPPLVAHAGSGGAWRLRFGIDSSFNGGRLGLGLRGNQVDMFGPGACRRLQCERALRGSRHRPRSSQ